MRPIAGCARRSSGLRTNAERDRDAAVDGCARRSIEEWLPSPVVSDRVHDGSPLVQMVGLGRTRRCG